MRPLDSIRCLLDLGVDVDLTPTDAKHVRFTNIVIVLVIAMMLPWTPVNVLAGEPLLALEIVLACSCLVGALLLNRSGRHACSAALTVLVGIFQVCYSVWMFGADTGVAGYFIITVFVPYLLFRERDVRYAHGLAFASAVLLALSSWYHEALPVRVFLFDLDLNRTINTAIIAVGVLLMAAAFRALVADTERALEAERARADRLLLNVLPAAVAERLKRSPDQAIADRHDEVTVLFADIVGFTPLSARLTAERTVELLNTIFTAFDAICDRAGVEKIRTIGDGYMAVAGAPIPRSDHATVMVRVAMEMRDYMASNPVDEPLQVRIGINSGGAVAGIVGTTRFHFDLWGDAINVAARMESLGEPGRIHLAEGTWSRVHEVIDCEPRGELFVKGKGEMPTWFVAG